MLNSASVECLNYYGDNDVHKAHEKITSLICSLSVIQKAGGFPTKQEEPDSDRDMDMFWAWYRTRHPFNQCRQPINITTQEITVQEWLAITKMRNEEQFAHTNISTTRA
jgi:hypothetical protein